MEGQSLLRDFSAPAADYRPAPLLVFNDEHEGEAGEGRISQVLEGHRRVGYGGVFLHPRPGLMTEYLSPRWFELIRHAVRECRRLGLVPYLYDENSYPSGFAGGHVPALVPEARTRYVSAMFGEGPDDVPEERLILHLWDGALPGREVEVEEIGVEQTWIAFTMRSMQPLAWHGDTVYPSLLDPRTTEAFIETTYEAYRRELGDLWREVPAVFTDEPHLPAEGHGPWSMGLHLTPYLLGQFRRRRGYDLREHLASVFYDVGDHRRVRFDLYDLMHELWIENWALPLEGWCDEHDIALTGHYLEHDWPCPYATPGHTHMLAHMRWPGTDMLESFLLKGHDFRDIQNFHPTGDGAEPHGLMYLRQVHSVANQLGKERVLDECWGAGGHDSTPADWARIGRWLIVHGVNLLVPHLSFLTIRGTRKADHPQTFSDHSPHYEHLRPLNDELSRLCWASNQGRVEQRVLVLDPLTTGFCVSKKADCLPDSAFAANVGASHNAGAPPSEEQFIRALASVAGLQRGFGEFAQAMSDAQVDFDLGDEYVIEEFGEVGDGVFGVGEQEYGLIVWPEGMTNLRNRTAEMLEEYLAGGGLLFGVGPGVVTVDGRPSDFLRGCEERYQERCRWFDTSGELLRRVVERVSPRLRTMEPTAGLAHMRRILPDSELFIIVNSSPEPVDGPVAVETGRRNVYELDPVSGVCYEMQTMRDGDSLSGHLGIKARRATLLWATDDVVPAERRRPEVRIADEFIVLQPKTIERLGPNVLVLDHCELELDGELFDPEAVYAANNRLWRFHGMDTNGWMAVIQHRDQVLARNRTFAWDSGGIAYYKFNVSEAPGPESIRLGVETPELWRVKVNERTVDLVHGECWLDDHIRIAEIGHLLRKGDNIVKLEGRPFDVRREIDQIYLLGEFACREDEVGFSLVPVRAMSLGSWRRQGSPFYDRTVSYTFELPMSGQGVLALGEEDWKGSLIVVEQEGKVVAQLRETPYQVHLDTNLGRSLKLQVVGLPKNLLGPWHDPSRQRGRAWIPMWYGTGIPTKPKPGSEYDLLDLGLFTAPKWSARG